MRRFLGALALLGAVAACSADLADRSAQREGVATNARERIAGFLAAQRELDSRSCLEEGLAAGSPAHEACVRARAEARRTARLGPAGDAIERAATGTCWNPQFRVRLACVDV
jgi:hypothetical protein